MSDNWIVQTLNNVLKFWNGALEIIWSLLTESPETFRGGDVWRVVVSISGGLQAIAYSLLILFFSFGIFNSATSFRDFRRPETSMRYFIHFLAAKTAITYATDILVGIFKICGGIINEAGSSLGAVTEQLMLPSEIVTAIEDVGFLASIPLMIVALLGYILITVLGVKLILTVYSRFFRLYMYTALAPVPLSAFGGDVTNSIGKAFIKSYVGVCLEGAVIVLACVIYNAYAGSGTLTLNDPDAETITIVLAYLTETVFNLLVLVGLVSGSDRIVREMTSL